MLINDLNKNLGSFSKLPNLLATCDTAADVAEKVIVTDDQNWELRIGNVIMVKFSISNSAGNVKLNVNNTGAYPIWYNNAEYTSTGTAYTGYANRIIMYMFNGTHWVWIGGSYDTNTTYTNEKLGNGYGTCATAEATAAKAVTLSSYTLVKNGIVSVKFTYAVPANATLNINSKGAKKIFYKGAAITAGIIKAGDIATFMYDGTQYHLVSIDTIEKLSNLQTTNKTSLVDAINEVFQNVDSGKQLIANAIDDESITKDSTFEAMSNKINDMKSNNFTEEQKSSVMQSINDIVDMFDYKIIE